MDELKLHDFHQRLGARFIGLNGKEAVADYGSSIAEYSALRENVGLLDLSFRSRLCLLGADRVRFLHGQVTNDVNGLREGEGCYAALVNAKGRMQSDLNIYRLPEELLLDFEPGLTPAISERLEKYIIADDAQLADATPHYGLLSLQGPKAKSLVTSLNLAAAVPSKPFDLVKISDAELGEIYLANQPRLNTCGFDLFVPTSALDVAAARLLDAAGRVGGRICGWEAFETARIEAGIPRFGPDMDETTIPLEAGLEERAISFSKGCYIGQEVISRIRTYSQVSKALRGLRLAPDLQKLPVKGDLLMHSGKEAGYVTSSAASPHLKANLALGYVRKEMNQIGSELVLRSHGAETSARIVRLPFEP